VNKMIHLVFSSICCEWACECFNSQGFCNFAYHYFSFYHI